MDKIELKKQPTFCPLEKNDLKTAYFLSIIPNKRYNNGVVSAVNGYAIDSYHRDKVIIELIKDD